MTIETGPPRIWMGEGPKEGAVDGGGMEAFKKAVSARHTGVEPWLAWLTH